MEVAFMSLLRTIPAVILLVAFVKASLVYIELPDCTFKRSMRGTLMATAFFVFWFMSSSLVYTFEKTGVEGWGVVGTVATLFATAGLLLVVVCMRMITKFIDV